MKQQPKSGWLERFEARVKKVGLWNALIESEEADGRVKTDLKDWRSAPGPLHLDQSKRKQ